VRSFRAILLLLGLLLPVAASADVAPLTPEGRLILAKRDWFEDQARARLGHDIIERSRDWRSAYGSILVGADRAGTKPRLLMKDEYGWYEVRPGATERLDPRVGHALNRLLLQKATWAGQPYRFDKPCRGAARLFVLRHAGQEQFGREPCGTLGLAGQVAEIAATLRAPSRPTTTTDIAAEPAPPGVPQDHHDLTSYVYDRLSDMTASWERKRLAGFVEPYAEDAVIERPEGTLKGRNEIVDWARRQQDWTTPGIGTRLTLHQASMPPAEGDAFYETHEWRWEEGGRPLRQTFSALWQKREGLWQIVQERVSEVKPVTERQ